MSERKLTDDLALGPEQLKELLDRDAADARSRALIERTKNDPAFRQAVEERNRLIQEADDAALGIDVEHARALLDNVSKQKEVPKRELWKPIPAGMKIPAVLDPPAKSPRDVSTKPRLGRTPQANEQEASEPAPDPDTTTTDTELAAIGKQRQRTMTKGLLLVIAGTVGVALLLALLTRPPPKSPASAEPPTPRSVVPESTALPLPIEKTAEPDPVDTAPVTSAGTVAATTSAEPTASVGVSAPPRVEKSAKPAAVPTATVAPAISIKVPSGPVFN